MANPKIKDAGVATRFQKGTSPNPGGKPVGSKNRLQGDFMKALSEDFAEHGKAAIVATRKNSPAQYLKVVASLMPKELEIKRPLEDLTDDDLLAGIAALQSLVDSQGNAGGTRH